MPVFLFIALILFGIAAILYFAPHLKILNIVDYESARSPDAINRYAAARLLIPASVSLGAAFIAGIRPDLMVPLIFLLMTSILVAVVWIAAGVNRLKA